MPEEFRWQPELIQNIRVAPWQHIPDKKCRVHRAQYVHRGAHDRRSRPDRRLQEMQRWIWIAFGSL
eukprot:5495757-Pyramimonas_sp.AAC.1